MYTPDTGVLSAFFKKQFFGISSWLTGLFSKKNSILESSAEATSASLIHQALAPQSTFDRLCASWAGQSWWVKLSTFSVVTLTFGVIGLFSGSPIILALSALACAVAIHSLLVYHNTQRLHQAQRIIEKTRAICTTEQVAEEVHQEVHHFLSEELEATQKASESIEEQATEIKQATTDLVSKNKEVISTIEQVEEQARGFNTVAKKAVERAQQFTYSAETFSTLVDDLGEEQALYTHAVDTLAGLVDGLAQNNAPPTREQMDSLAITSRPARMRQYQKDLTLFDDVLRIQQERLDMEQAEIESMALRHNSRNPPPVPREVQPDNSAQDFEEQSPYWDEHERQIEVNAAELQTFDRVLRMMQEHWDMEQAERESIALRTVSCIQELAPSEAQDLAEQSLPINLQQEELSLLNEVTPEHSVEMVDSDVTWFLDLEAQAKDRSFQEDAQTMVQESQKQRFDLEQKRLDESSDEEWDINLLNRRLAEVQARRMARATRVPGAEDALMRGARARFGFDFNSSDGSEGHDEEKNFSMQ